MAVEVTDDGGNPYESTQGSKAEPSQQYRRGKIRSRPPLPMRTWLVVLVVLISGAGLVGSSLAVNVILREVLYQKVDDDLTAGIDSWARGNQLQRASSITGLPSDYSQITLSPYGSIRIVNDQGSPPDYTEITEYGVPLTIDSMEHSLEEREWRAIAAQGPDGTVTIVAKSLDQEKNLLRSLLAIQTIIAIIVLVFIGLAAHYFVRRALRPLREVEVTALAIAGGDLERRVPEWPRETEVGELSYALNKMLGRLTDSVEESRRKEQQMRRFVGDASHELRTPLTSLRGFTELYRQGATDDVDFVLGKIDDESKRMKFLVEDLLALTRAEGSRLNLKGVDMLELTLAVASSARAAFPERSISVENTTASIPLIQGDPDRMHQILLNLVVNGLRHGGQDAEVKLRLRQDEDNVFVDVADNGIGMDEQVTQHIFERFYRADTSRSRGNGGGSGLGLAITKSLVDQHNGTVTVTSKEGEGSTFTVTIPRLRDSLATESSSDAEADS